VVTVTLEDKGLSHHGGGREEPSAAKPQPKESDYLPQRRKGRKEKEIIFIRTWRSSRLGGTNIRIRDVSYVGKFTQAAKSFKQYEDRK
jgi:hypothetical protein